MMYQEIDCRGLSCPQPVINTKKALEKIAEGTVTVIVDNEAAKENLVKFAKGMDFSSKVDENQGEFKISIHKGFGYSAPQSVTVGYSESLQQAKGSYVILMTSNVLGRGNDELGEVLVKSFFYTLTEQDNLPKAIAFINSGVSLTCQDSPVLEHILDIEKKGCEILSCGTCLDFYKIKDKLCAGSVSNMYAILDMLQKVDKVITL